jgi:D-sedoheptulose 7-phosphate isomerase
MDQRLSTMIPLLHRQPVDILRLRGPLSDICCSISWRKVNKTMPNFTESFLDQTVSILRSLDTDPIEQMALSLSEVRDNGGRLFILGVGGSAGHASHAVNDFRKLCNIETYTPTDNVSEFSARANDEGWDSTFSGWLMTSQLRANDAVLVFSVGGGDRERNISSNIVAAIDLCVEKDVTVLGIVGRTGGYTARYAKHCLIIPPLFEDFVTPHTEGLCAVIWHLLVSHPTLARTATKWESTR